MKWISMAACGLTTLLVSMSCQAQIDYSDVKVGSLLDDKGIRIGAFIKPVPLPVGSWLVVARNDSRLSLSNGSFTSKVTFTLKSTDANNGIFALLVSFAPDSIPVRWTGNYCDTANKVFSSSYGSGGSTSANACATGQWYTKGLRAFMGSAPTHAVAQVREQYAGLAPYAAQAPEPYAGMHINARRDRGRTLDYTVYARIPAGFRVGDGFDTQTQEWVKTSAQSMMDMLENTATPMPAFPSATGANTLRPVAVDGNSTDPKGVDLATLQAGVEVSDAIALPSSGPALPLPPGRWIVAGRHDDWIDSQNSNTTLTFKNSDVTAGLAVLVMTLQPMQFNASKAMDRCQGTAKTQFQWIEDMGTNANSTVSVCAVGGLYSASLKKMVSNAPTSSSPWFKENLASLVPYVADLPDAHIWLTIDAGRNKSRRLQWTLYGRVPAGLLPTTMADAPLREWIRSMGQSLTSFHNNQYLAIAPYPAISVKP